MSAQTRDLDGAVAVVTGAGQGLGRAEALALAAAGAQVVVNDIGDAADAVVAEITDAGGRAVSHIGDIGDWEFGASLVQKAVDTYGDLNVLVNNAGFLRDKMVFSISEDDWDAVIRVHLKGHAATCRAATAYWREKSKASGEPVYARVVNTTSEAALFGSPGQPNYSAAKAGITALTMSVVGGCSRYGVRANVIAPRARTAMTEQAFGPAPEGDGVDPYGAEHVAPVVVWLASRGADAVNGQLFVVYGGKVGVMTAPTLTETFATSNEVFSVEELDTVAGPYFAGGPRGFAVDPSMSLS